MSYQSRTRPRTRTPGAKRIPSSQLAPKAQKLRAQGYSVPQIAKKLNRSVRYVYTLFANANLKTGLATIVEIPEPKPLSDLTPEQLERLEYTADGFEKFFNRFSGRTLTPLHKEWVDRVIRAEHKRVLINCPPRHAKSTIFSVWFPIWLITANRDIQILLISQTTTLAKKFANEISWHLSYNEALIQDYGRFRPELIDWPWRAAQGELLVEGRKREVKSGDMTLQIRGAGQHILGMEADWSIVDDPVDHDAAVSPAMRKSLSEWFHSYVMSRLEPNSTALVIGQRLHLHDLYGELSRERDDDNNPHWEHLVYPAVKDWETEEVLWPDKWNFKELMKRKRDVGAQAFSSLYQQEPISPEDRLVRREWVYGDDEHVGCLDLTRESYEEAIISGQRVRVMSLDPSPTRFWGFIVGDLDWNRDQFRFHILEVQRERWNVRDAIHQLRRAYDMYLPQYLVIERNSAHHFLQNPSVDDLKRKMSFIAHDTVRQTKSDPILGVESLAMDFEFGRIRLPYGNPEGKTQSHLLIEEAEHYPYATTDDVLMALWFIKSNFRRLVPRLNKTNTISSGFAWEIPPRLQNGWS